MSLAFDFFFVPPRLTFAVSDFQYVVTFAVMLIVALIIASLVASVRAQTRVAGARERRTSLLYAMSRELAATRSATISLGSPSSTSPRLLPVTPWCWCRTCRRTSASTRVARHCQSACATPICRLRSGSSITVGRPDSAPTRFPQRGAVPAASGTSRTLGVLAVRPTQRRRLLLPEQQHLLEDLCGTDCAWHSSARSLAEEAEERSLPRRPKSLRNTLLASISHDLRTPLAVIAGASSALNDPSLCIRREARDATGAIDREQGPGDVGADLQRARSHALRGRRSRLRRDWQTVDDLVGTALGRVEQRLSGHHPVEVDLPDAIFRRFASMLRSSRRYSPICWTTACEAHSTRNAHRHIRRRGRDASVRVVVDDNGPGLPPGDPERLFAKFQRGRDESNTGGAGSGLAICRAIVTAHGGTITATPRPGGGTRFDFHAADSGNRYMTTRCSWC